MCLEGAEDGRLEAPARNGDRVGARNRAAVARRGAAVARLVGDDIGAATDRAGDEPGEHILCPAVEPMGRDTDQEARRCGSILRALPEIIADNPHGLVLALHPIILRTGTPQPPAGVGTSYPL